ncbi:uncharacterized protein LOC109824206 [Asparagus officinalis]|uniref:uncharacterized protein LOC109824206 n=1 Tax=Asparagus officinalis TaxID=4686 RepID=UPI00098E3D1F|nr:uncharacterized protein LOC109824206 [Asparagus officinalis]
MAYHLTLSKNVRVGSQGRTQNDQWHWRPILCRPISQEENQEVTALKTLITHLNDPNCSQSDGVIWPLSSIGKYTVNSLYRFIFSGGNKFAAYYFICLHFCHPRSRSFYGSYTNASCKPR